MNDEKDYLQHERTNEEIASMPSRDELVEHFASSPILRAVSRNMASVTSGFMKFDGHCFFSESHKHDTYYKQWYIQYHPSLVLSILDEAERLAEL